MKLAILKIILWPKDTTLEPRIVSFVPGKINVLTGESGAGKSALTWIIDYCLGSDKCSIPIGLIRELTDWFGLHLQLANTEMIVARRNPEDQQSTNEFFWTEGLGLSVPPIVQKNARVEDLKNRFNQISNIPTFDASLDEGSGYSGRASFRDMAAFNFQPQHIVANPFTFFFKADTTEHREKLKIIFPLALGVVNASTLAAQRELKDMEREHDKLRRELDARLGATRAWEAEVEGYYLQARALGLLPGSPVPLSSWTLDKYILELQKVPDAVRAQDLPDVPEGTSESAVVELTQLVSDEDRISEEIGSVRRRLAKLDQLSASVSEYGVVLTGQEDRLVGVGWFEEKIRSGYECPVCAAVHVEENPRLNDLRTLARELSTLTASVRDAPPKFDEELLVLRQELRDREATVSKVRQKRKYLEDRSSVLAAQRQRVRQIYLFVGRVEQALENVRASQNVDDLRQKVQKSEERIATLRRKLDPHSQRNRLNATIDTVSARIASYAGLLQLEHASENVRLNTRELTLQFSPLSGRTDYLWEVGSGQNWVGYHIAGLLALHEHFINLGHQNAVPRFLVIDQPSQVYFPEAWPSIDETPEKSAAVVGSSDIEGVRRIFKALSHFMNSVNCQFQIIVTEHAGSITWAGVPHVNLAGNWRGGHDEFLIPTSWISDRDEARPL